MNYDQLIIRLKDEDMARECAEYLREVVDGVHAEFPDAEYEVTSKHHVGVFVLAGRDAMQLAMHRRRKDIGLQYYHPDNGGGGYPGRPASIIVSWLGCVFRHDDDVMKWTSDGHGRMCFYKTDNHDIYYGDTALAAVKAFAQDTGLPLHKAFRCLRQIDSAWFAGQRLQPLQGVEAGYLGTAVLRSCLTSMKERFAKEDAVE